MVASVFKKSDGFLAGSAAAQVSRRQTSARFVLRARGDLKLFEKAFGVLLPETIGARVSSAEIEVLCLGPDEWLIVGSEGAYLAEKCAMFYQTLPHSLVDVSNREVTFEIEGAKAIDLLAIGCPRDLETIKIGEGRRTVFDGVSVVIWRDDKTCFRMDVWNSFAEHVLGLLEVGCRELTYEL